MSEFCVGSLFCNLIHSTHSSLSDHIAKKERAGCLIFIVFLAVSVLCLCLKVQYVALQSVIVTFPGHIQLLFDISTAFLLTMS